MTVSFLKLMPFLCFLTFFSSTNSVANTSVQNLQTTDSSTPGDVLWRAQSASSSSPALGNDGTIYLGRFDGLVAINPDGSQKWLLEIEGVYGGYSTIGPDGSIHFYAYLRDQYQFVDGVYGHLYVVNPDGTIRWRSSRRSIRVIGNDGTIHMGEGKGLLEFNIDGSIQLQSQFDVDSNLFPRAIGEDGTIYMTGGDKLHAISPDRQLLWSKYIYRMSDSDDIAIGDDGTLYITARNELYAINADGSEKWNLRLDWPLIHAPVIAEDGTIYVAAFRDLYSISPEGTENWSLDITYRDSLTAPLIGDDGTIYFVAQASLADSDQFVIALNPDGSESWRTYFDERLYGVGLSMSSDGTLYVSAGGELHAFATSSSGLAKSSWPKEYQNALNTGNVAYLYSPLDNDNDGIYDDIDLDDDNDGMPDSFEHANELDSFNTDDANTDKDNDGLTNIEEYNLGTAANNIDSDDDGLSDSAEIAAGTDPTVSNFQQWIAHVDRQTRSNVAIARDGTVYISSFNYSSSDEYPGYQLFAYNPDGSLRWTAPLELEKYSRGSIAGTPSIGKDGTIYVNSLRYLHAVNPDGTKRWKTRVHGLSRSNSIGSDGTIYVQGEADNSYRDAPLFYAFNRDGSLKWRRFPEDGSRYIPAIGSDGTIYVASKYLYAWNNDGTERWFFDALSDVSSSPAIGNDGSIYFTASESRFQQTGNYLYSINEDGIEQWRFAVEAGLFSSPTIGNDGVIYFGADDHYLYAVNPDGTLNWRFETKNMIRTSATVGSDGTIYLTSSDGYFYAINSDGSLKWRYETKDKIFPSSATLHEDGSVYFTSKHGSLYKLSSDSAGTGDSSWSKAGGNAQNTGRLPTNGSLKFTDFDFDGDGKADVAVRRPGNATQYLKITDDGWIQRINFGGREGDIPLSGDFDGDTVADVAIFRPTTNYWYIRNSSRVDSLTGFADGISRIQFGEKGDIPVPA